MDYKHTRKVLGIGIICFAVAICFFTFPRNTSLSGRWEPVEGRKPSIGYLEFFKDGTYVSGHSNYEGNYSVDGKRIRLQGVLVDSLTYTYKIKEDKLTLFYSDGDEYCVFEKVAN